MTRVICCIAIVSCSLVACVSGRGEPPVHAPRSSAAPSPVARAAVAPPERLAVVRLTSDAKLDNRLSGDLRLEGPLSATTTLRFAPSHDVRIESVTARDDVGPIDLRVVSEGTATRLELARAAKSPLLVHYVLVFGTATDPFAPLAEPIELRGGGEDLLVLPELDEAFPVEIHLAMGGGGASSFAIGADQKTTARPSELRRAYLLAGDVGTSMFHTSLGDDIAAWVGPTAFDPRWVSAEIAGVRTVTDAYVGRTPDANAPPVSYLFTSTRREESPVLVAARARGLVISVDRRAEWTPEARILVAQALLQRYLGGFLWVGDRSAPATGYFFSDGFSRAIARDVLFDGGALTAADRATELNALLATLAFTSEPRHLAAARGALLATALDVALRVSATPRTLKTFVRERLADAANSKRDALSLAELFTKVEETAGRPFTQIMKATLDSGAEVPLPRDLAGPCYRLSSALLVPFELGFVTTAGEQMTIASLKPGSRADAAGVRVGDAVVSLHYEAGRSQVPVTMVVLRNARKVSLRFLPAGLAKPGRVFERVKGVPDDRC